MRFFGIGSGGYGKVEVAGEITHEAELCGYGVFGDNIRDIRVQKGLSQQQVAEHIGTSLTQVRRWEAGQTAPSIDNAALLARFYNVSLDRLCGLQDRPDLDLEGLDEKQIEALKAVVEGFKR